MLTLTLLTMMIVMILDIMMTLMTYKTYNFCALIMREIISNFYILLTTLLDNIK